MLAFKSYALLMFIPEEPRRRDRGGGERWGSGGGGGGWVGSEVRAKCMGLILNIKYLPNTRGSGSKILSNRIVVAFRLGINCIKLYHVRSPS